jgi:hypothetical protein
MAEIGYTTLKISDGKVLIQLSGSDELGHSSLMVADGSIDESDISINLGRVGNTLKGCQSRQVELLQPAHIEQLKSFFKFLRIVCHKGRRPNF